MDIRINILEKLDLYLFAANVSTHQKLLYFLNVSLSSSPNSKQIQRSGKIPSPHTTIPIFKPIGRTNSKKLSIVPETDEQVCMNAFLILMHMIVAHGKFDFSMRPPAIGFGAKEGA